MTQTILSIYGYYLSADYQVKCQLMALKFIDSGTADSIADGIHQVCG